MNKVAEREVLEPCSSSSFGAVVLSGSTLRGPSCGRYDEKFYRMWKFYLLASAGSFRAPPSSCSRS